jgi:hypothetical protein
MREKFLGQVGNICANAFDDERVTTVEVSHSHFLGRKRFIATDPES